MDMLKVILKYKMNAKGTHHIAYCEEYPQIQGIGPSEGQATANFWKAYNNAESKTETQATQQKRSEKAAAEQLAKKKKAA
ncbi:MAG: hypothetical protein WCG27_10990 [Pseudomonadota bacterium]